MISRYDILLMRERVMSLGSKEAVLNGKGLIEFEGVVVDNVVKEIAEVVFPGIGDVFFVVEYLRAVIVVGWVFFVSGVEVSFEVDPDTLQFEVYRSPR